MKRISFFYIEVKLVNRVNRMGIYYRKVFVEYDSILLIQTCIFWDDAIST